MDLPGGPDAITDGAGAFGSHYDDISKDFSNKWGFLGRQNMELMVGHIVAAFGPGARTVIDVGAGTGMYSLPIAEKLGPRGRVFCLEPSAPMLDRVPSDDRLVKILGSSKEFSKGTLPRPVHAILLKESIHHILKDRVRTLEAMAEHLAPGGRIVVVMMHNPISHPVSPAFRKEFMQWHPTAIDIRNDLRKAGMTESSVESHRYPVDMTPRQFMELYRSRYISLQSTLSQSRIEQDLLMMRRGKNIDLPHPFEHDMTFITAQRPPTRGAVRSAHIS
jgi:ubiquinone/menaquinone biosynthesis C-methylase UbiE